MTVGISLRQIAADQHVSYEMARRWATRNHWKMVRKPCRTLGVCALYDYDQVQDFLAAREERPGKAAA